MGDDFGDPGWPGPPGPPDGGGGAEAEEQSDERRLYGDASTWHRETADRACEIIAEVEGVHLDAKGTLILVEDRAGVTPRIREVGPPQIPDLLGRANVVICDAVKRKPLDAPDVLRQTMISRRFPGAPWRRFDGFANGPYILPDGEIVQAQGYSPERRLWLPYSGHVEIATKGRGSVRPHGFASHDEGATALRWVLSEMAEFPWADPALDPAVWLAYLMTLIVRPACPTVPMFLAEASIRRSGKDLLLKCAEVTAYNRFSKRIDSKSGDETELSKTIGAAFLEGHTSLVFGDVKSIGNGLILGLITEPEEQTIRVLGESASVPPPKTLTLAATANNVKFPLPDLIPRTVAVRLSPKTPNPEYVPHRKNQDQLLGWFRAHRAPIIAAVMNAVRGYIHRRKDPETEPTGIPCETFPTWASIVRDPLMYYGFADVLESQQRLAAQVPVGDEDEMRALFAAWWTLLRDQAGITSARLLQMAASPDTGHTDEEGRYSARPDPDRQRLADALGAIFGGAKVNAKTLTEKLQNFRDTPLDIDGQPFRLRSKVVHNTKTFALERMS